MALRRSQRRRGRHRLGYRRPVSYPEQPVSVPERSDSVPPVPAAQPLAAKVIGALRRGGAFLVVGAIGFLVDAGTYNLLVFWGGEEFCTTLRCPPRSSRSP